VTRNTSRTPYEDGNVIIHNQSVEHILDDIFAKLHFKDAIDEPIFMTEVVANPPCCRRETSELLFEAYGVPKVAYAVDGPLGYYKANWEISKTALIITIGNYSTIITAMVNGQVRPEHVKKITIGGHLMSEMMLQLLQCKYPTFPIKMTFAQAQEVFHRACRVALDYDEKLYSMINSDDVMASEDLIVQFPYSTETLAERLQKEQTRENIAAKRREQAKKLRERASRQRNEKLEAKKQQLESMRKLAKQVAGTVNADGSFDDEEEDRVLQQLKLFGYESIGELQDAIEDEQKDLNRMLGIEEPKEAPDYSLVDVPDAELTTEQIKEKRKQRLLKSSAEARERIKKEKAIEEQRMKEERQRLEQQRINDFEGWRRDLYTERDNLIKGIKARQKKKDALSDRKSQAAGAKLRNVVSLIEDEEEEQQQQQQSGSKSTKKRRTKKEKETATPMEVDGFGDDDADWLIYRQISRDDEAEGEREEAMQTRLSEIEEELEKHDCEAFYELVAREMNMAVTILDKLRNGVFVKDVDPNASKMQLHINVERYRVVESLFQPSAIVGLEQAGLIEAIEELLKLFGMDIRAQLCENVFLTGGTSQIDGLQQRITKGLTMIQPADSNISVRMADNPVLDTWRGAALLCRNDANNLIPWITKEWYDEHGGDRLPAHTWFTNQF
jgi:actin-related protein 5